MGKVSAVVYAEDDSLVRSTVAELLKVLGAEVLSCANGAEAVELCKNERPEVAILDLNMPILDGFQAARKIRADPSLANVRLVALTGRPDSASRDRAIEAGFDIFLSKPATPEILLRAIQAVAACAILEFQQTMLGLAPC